MKSCSSAVARPRSSRSTADRARRRPGARGVRHPIEGAIDVGNLERALRRRGNVARGPQCRAANPDAPLPDRSREKRHRRLDHVRRDPGQQRGQLLDLLQPPARLGHRLRRPHELLEPHRIMVMPLEARLGLSGRRMTKSFREEEERRTTERREQGEEKNGERQNGLTACVSVTPGSCGGAETGAMRMDAPHGCARRRPARSPSSAVRARRRRATASAWPTMSACSRMTPSARRSPCGK